MKGPLSSLEEAGHAFGWSHQCSHTGHGGGHAGLRCLHDTACSFLPMPTCPPLHPTRLCLFAPPSAHRFVPALQCHVHFSLSPLITFFPSAIASNWALPPASNCLPGLGGVSCSSCCPMSTAACCKLLARAGMDTSSRELQLLLPPVPFTRARAPGMVWGGRLR